MKYNRILLKLSGESLQGTQKYGLSTDVLHSYAEQIKAVVGTGVQVGIVIGGGNIFRGLQGARKGFDRVKGDQMGMLATIINSLALQSALEDNGVKAKVLTSIRMEPIGEYYSKAKALRLPRSRIRSHHRRRHVEPLFLDRLCIGAARHRDRSRRHAQGYARRRRLYGRSGERPRRREVRRNHLR